MRRILTLALASMLCACGNGAGDDDGADAASDAETDICGFSSDRYLPYEVGFTWEWRVTDPYGGSLETKTQVIQETRNHPDDGLPMYVQMTDKDGGSTENWTRLDGDALVRLQQMDYNSVGDLLRTTVYSPPRIRLDEAAGHISAGATFTESYTEIEYDSTGAEVLRTDMVEEWEVLGVDVECSSPLGTFRCLHISRTRTQGGIAQKEFMYASGIGKVREDGGQIEQLTACGIE